MAQIDVDTARTYSTKVAGVRIITSQRNGVLDRNIELHNHGRYPASSVFVPIAELDAFILALQELQKQLGDAS